MKKTLWSGAVVLVLLIAGYVMLPFHALEQLQRAAQMAVADEPETRRESIDTLERYVDFPVLRDNLKLRLQSQLRSSIGNSIPQEFDELVTAGANFFMGPLLQQFITPEGVARLLRGGEDLQAFERELFAQDSQQEAAPVLENDQETGGTSNSSWQRMSWRFTDINHLSAEYGENDRAELRVLMQRNGLHWQLVDIELISDQGREG
ncbi:DUF2939 domain-containing protein [Microbulbifer variabilis]|uniref:DUF2939 domain-containing protein n=1 Tax=Microbulbifer variabilis TaxID=266805 RepID=UPI0003624A41|nr:DUF2939 domain-containing protein [Microbulbifer variabilis]